MSKKHANRWTYGISTIIFFFVAVINFWMILADGFTTFRLIAAIAFLIGGILLLGVFNRVRRLG
jgi:heme/copper-type cytochrome/quinol oxidase subunit 4